MDLFNNNEIGYIFNQDCLYTSKLINNHSIDLIIADPPYYKIANKKDAEWDYEWEDVEEYIAWSKTRILQFRDILKNTGSFYLWGAIGYSNGYSLPKLADWIESNQYFKVINWITQKNTHVFGTKKGFPPCREELVFMVPWKCETSYYFKPQYTNESTNRKDLGANGKPRKNDKKRCTDVWIDMNFEDELLCNEIWSDITEASQSSKQRFYMSDGKKHPTVKALKLCDRILDASSKEDQIVYIPFAGTGSEIVSCINNKRKFIASEITQEYIDEIILKRLKNDFKSLIRIELDSDINCYKLFYIP
ncbi:DNA-methyltransferase [Clostridium manihotivorum]|uniref:Methyltransferase n=1 Tax=Clostridium manihotivorum TaxID=2320868 RepID=A0A410DQJ4_9CLOT|nr:site-specific DNA-methyltransferase [Clostridium manihotivorum]QAA31328.1 hypothetical protein C1I91_06545 [Clostridium manihotivorum]